MRLAPNFQKKWRRYREGDHGDPLRNATGKRGRTGTGRRRPAAPMRGSRSRWSWSSPVSCWSSRGTGIGSTPSAGGSRPTAPHRPRRPPSPPPTATVTPAAPPPPTRPGHRRSFHIPCYPDREGDRNARFRSRLSPATPRRDLGDRDGRRRSTDARYEPWSDCAPRGRARRADGPPTSRSGPETSICAGLPRHPTTVRRWSPSPHAADCSEGRRAPWLGGRTARTWPRSMARSSRSHRPATAASVTWSGWTRARGRRAATSSTSRAVAVPTR